MAREREAAGDSIIGYKLGLISPDKQRQMGVSEPIIGHVHRSMIINPGEPVRRDRFIQPRMEPELAVVFGRPVGEGARPGQIAAAIDFVLLVIDVLDSIYAGYRFTAGDVVADNASGGAVVVGSRVLPADVLFDGDDRRLRLLTGRTWHGGSVDSLGDPIGWIAWAADKAASLGRGVRRGDMLLLGSPCPAVPLPEAGPLLAEGPLGSHVLARVE